MSEEKKITRIKDLVGGESVLLRGTLGKKLGKTRNGDPFLTVFVKDLTGTASQNVWGNSDLYPVVDELEDGISVEVTAVVEKVGQYNNILIKTIEECEPVSDELVNIKDRTEDLREVIRSISDPELKQLVTNVFKREDVKRGFFVSPGSLLSYGHKGGLLQHTIRLVRLAKNVCLAYNDFAFDGTDLEFDQDLLLTAVILHDIGKVLAFENNGVKFKKTKEGELFNDSYLTIKILLEELSSVSLSEERGMLLEHIVSSAKGNPNHGALFIPRSKEAIVLHHIDALDSQLSNLEYLNREMNGEDFARFIDRQYYIGDI